MKLFVIKFFLSFTVSFFILSIPIKRRPIFDHLYRLIAPYTERTLQEISTKAERNISSLKERSKLLFTGNTPPPAKDEDKNRRELTPPPLPPPAEETFSDEERELMKKVIEKSNNGDAPN